MLVKGDVDDFLGNDSQDLAISHGTSNVNGTKTNATIVVIQTDTKPILKLFVCVMTRYDILKM